MKKRIFVSIAIIYLGLWAITGVFGVKACEVYIEDRFTFEIRDIPLEGRLVARGPVGLLSESKLPESAFKPDMTYHGIAVAPFFIVVKSRSNTFPPGYFILFWFFGNERPFR